VRDACLVRVNWRGSAKGGRYRRIYSGGYA
jgi:hypothetical protein